MFENLTSKFEEIFSSLKNAPSLNEAQVDEGLRKIRQALLEADVALSVTKELIKNIKPFLNRNTLSFLEIKVTNSKIKKLPRPNDLIKIKKQFMK